MVAAKSPIAVVSPLLSPKGVSALTLPSEPISTLIVLSRQYGLLQLGRSEQPAMKCNRLHFVIKNPSPLSVPYNSYHMWYHFTIALTNQDGCL